MLTHEVFIHQIIVDGIQRRVNAARNPRHFCHFLHDDRVMYRIVRIFPLGEWPVLIHDNAWRMQRFHLAQRFDDHLTGVQLVLALHFFFA